MRKLLIGAIFVGAMALDANPAPAYPLGPQAAWCAVINLGPGDAYWDCRYASIEQCRPNVLAGNRGFCNPNPAYVGMAAAPEPVRRRHHRRHVQRY
jgi:hypothetical protein